MVEKTVNMDPINASNNRALKPNQLPKSATVGLKLEHCKAVLATNPALEWFEVHPENYMGEGGPAHHYLNKIRERYEISMHGVGLSIGGSTRPSKDHMKRVKTLLEHYKPASFSEHLAWSSHEAGYFNDLLPLPLTEETCATVSDHIDEIQSTVGHRLLLENPSTYVEFTGTSFAEIDFLTEVVSRTGCGLLLDVNNVYVSCINHQTDPVRYIDEFPIEHVGEVHLGGHANDEDDLGDPLLIDAHDRAVIDKVWALYKRTIKRAGPLPTLVEWDNNVPDWPVLYAEAQRAASILNQSDKHERHAENKLVTDHEVA